jgi:hypothetical protein
MRRHDVIVPFPSRLVTFIAPPAFSIATLIGIESVPRRRFRTTGWSKFRQKNLKSIAPVRQSSYLAGSDFLAGSGFISCRRRFRSVIETVRRKLFPAVFRRISIYCPPFRRVAVNRNTN